MVVDVDFDLGHCMISSVVRHMDLAFHSYSHYHSHFQGHSHSDVEDEHDEALVDDRSKAVAVVVVVDDEDGYDVVDVDAEVDNLDAVVVLDVGKIVSVDVLE